MARVHDSFNVEVPELSVADKVALKLQYGDDYRLAWALEALAEAAKDELYAAYVKSIKPRE